MRNFSSKKTQGGVVLIISIVVVIALTLFVLGGLNLSNSQFQVINNYSEQKRAEAAAREVLEMVLNQQRLFTSAIAGETIDTLKPDSSGALKPSCPEAFCKYLDPNGGELGEYLVTLSMPYCYGTKRADGYSALSGVAPEDTHWEIVATARNKQTGATATIVEGIKIRFGQGNCEKT